jgi:hypothetical protein
MTTFCRVRATETHVVIEGPRTMALTPRETAALIEALTVKLAEVRAFQATQVVVPPISVQQLSPYPEQADGQLKHLEEKRELILTANEQRLREIWRHERRKHTV